METITVRTRTRKYPVLVQEGLLSDAGEHIRRKLACKRVVVVADSRVSELHGKVLKRSLRRAGIKNPLWTDLPQGERVKSLKWAQTLYRLWVDHGVDRWTPVVAFGGGVVGDLAAFAASTYFRGVPVVQVPSTVVAQVDSSIGGKTAVNFSGAKNLIGTFYQPHLVITDPLLLATLSPRDYRAGLAEAVKIAVTLRPDLMTLLETRTEEVLKRHPELMTGIIAACVEAKAEVVGRDETDQDVRSILNYGHTIGHALESHGKGRLRHGEAVAIGMRAATIVGEQLKVTSPEVSLRQNELLSRLGLKLSAPWADKREVTRNLKLDKKVRDRSRRFVLTLQIGGASVWPNVPVGPVKQALTAVTT